MLRSFYLVLIYTFLTFSTEILSAQVGCVSNNRYIDPIFQQVEVLTGIKFGEANPYNPLINNQELFLDLYQPLGDSITSRPVIVHAFGGGFLSGNRTGDDIPYWGTEYAKRGYVFVSVDYRTGYNPIDGGSTERAAYRCMQDIRAALRYLADNVQTYNLDINNFFLTGNSSGSIGGLVSVFMDDNDRPNSTFGTFFEPSNLGCMDCSGNTNFNNQKVPIKAHINLWGAVYDTNYINIAQNIEDNVPVISFHGTADAVVPFNSGNPYGLFIFPTVYGSNPMHIRLNNQGIRNELVPLAGLPHEPEAQYPWVSDTIISKATKFIYPIVYGDSTKIFGDTTICTDSIQTFFAANIAGSSYCWSTSTGQIINQVDNTVEISWNTQGNHLLVLTETTKIGVTKKDSIWVSVSLPPTTSFNYNANDGLVQFNLTNNNLLNAQWQFGDGNTSNLLAPTHQYLDTGFFEIQLNIKDVYCSADTVFSVVSNKCPFSNLSYQVVDSFIYLYNFSELSDSIFWVVENGSILHGDTLIYQVSDNGNYPFILYSFNQYCFDTVMINIDVLLCSKSNFSYTANNLSVQFFDESFNAYFYLWNFGNGNTSGAQSPAMQTFPDYGTYTVELVTYNIEGCTDTLYKEIELTAPNSIGSNNAEQKFKIYPNPVSDVLYFENANQQISKTGQIKIYSITGKLVFEQPNLKPLNTKQAGIISGIYLVEIMLNNQVLIEKIIVK